MKKIYDKEELNNNFKIIIMLLSLMKIIKLVILKKKIKIKVKFNCDKE